MNKRTPSYRPLSFTMPADLKKKKKKLPSPLSGPAPDPNPQTNAVETIIYSFQVYIIQIPSPSKELLRHESTIHLHQAAE